MNLRATNHPEFDAWRWNEYWVPLDAVIEFKRGVYETALNELSRYLPEPGRPNGNRYLRGNLRGQRVPPHEDPGQEEVIIRVVDPWPSSV